MKRIRYRINYLEREILIKIIKYYFKTIIWTLKINRLSLTDSLIASNLLCQCLTGLHISNQDSYKMANIVIITRQWYSIYIRIRIWSEILDHNINGINMDNFTSQILTNKIRYILQIRSLNLDIDKISFMEILGWYTRIISIIKLDRCKGTIHGGWTIGIDIMIDSKWCLCLGVINMISMVLRQSNFKISTEKTIIKI